MDKIQTTDCYVPVKIKSDFQVRHWRGDEWVRNKNVVKKENMVVLTVEEYLADKKKTAEDAFEAGLNEVDAEEYIKSLLP